MATVRDLNKNFILAAGPFKLEVIRVTSVTNDDTISSRLANPLLAMMFPDGDAGGTVGCSASVSGRTITLRDPSSATNHFVVVVGF